MPDLSSFESAADAAFASQPLPHPNMYVAAWYLMTVSEDSQRMMFCNAGEQLNDWRIVYFLDRYKFALRHCLAAVFNQAADRTAMALPTKIVPALYVRAHQALAVGIDFSVATQICASAHAGGARVVNEKGGFSVELNEEFTDMRYGALELLRHSAGEVVVSFAGLLWGWIRHWEEHLPMVGHQIASSTRLSKRRIRYNYEPELAYLLAQNVPQPALFIPDGWKFPWGGRNETTLLVNALCLRVLYHLIAVHFGAGAIALKGGAEGDLCVCLSSEQWSHDIALLSSLDAKQINLFIRYLTYGNGVESPDQALQPFVPLGSACLGVAGIGLLSSDIERNLLTLQARLEPRLFDAQSSIFEVEMTRQLRAILETKWHLVTANRTFRLGNAREEIDLLICELETKTVLVLELRWMLPPADPREVQARKRVCLQKVDQVARKLDAARANLKAMLQTAFSIAVESPSDWNVHAAVVIQGFGGAVTQRELIPVVPDWVLEAGVRVSPSLNRLVKWMQSQDWLPVEGKDYAVGENPADLSSMKVRFSGLMPIRPGRAYLEDATAMLLDN